jgi:ABC-type proline/glycine betaine transport system permease subunit
VIVVLIALLVALGLGVTVQRRRRSGGVLVSRRRRRP